MFNFVTGTLIDPALNRGQVTVTGSFTAITQDGNTTITLTHQPKFVYSFIGGRWVVTESSCNAIESVSTALNNGVRLEGVPSINPEETITELVNPAQMDALVDKVAAELLRIEQEVFLPYEVYIAAMEDYLMSVFSYIIPGYITLLQPARSPRRTPRSSRYFGILIGG